MKKLIIFFIIALLFTGCINKENKVDTKKKETKKQVVIEKDTYKDLNNTPIGIYQLNGNTLTKLHEYKTTFVPEQDINTFQLYPSNEESIKLDSSFGKSFYNEWNKYNK